MIVYLGADHRGFRLKNKLKHFVAGLGYETIDLGDETYNQHDDYTDFAAAVARKVGGAPEKGRGIILCGSGVGVDVVANKFSDVRSALGVSADQVRHARKTDDVNVLSLDADFVTELEAQNMIHAFLETPFAHEERYLRRLEKIHEIEREVSRGRARGTVRSAEVMPVLNCLTREEAERTLRIARGFAKKIHLDVADGKFTFHKTWADPGAWARFKNDFELEVHLMVENSEEATAQWLRVGAKRAIVHFETIHRASSRNILKHGKEHGAEIMLATNPDTAIEDADFYLPMFSSHQVLAVNPGLSGQAFQVRALEKIKFLRARYPNATIEVDGGINPETAQRARHAGADTFVASSAIFGSKNPEEAYRKLMHAVH